MKHQIARTSEHVGCGHPDKFCDQLADTILDESLRRCKNDKDLRSTRTAIEILVKDNLVCVSGETRWPTSIQSTMMCGDKDIHALTRKVWEDVGYGSSENVAIINNIRSQSPDINIGTGVGAGDQGIMVGYATDETPEMMPLEWVLARDLCMKLNDLWRSKTIPVKSDCKSQVTLDANRRLTNLIIAVQHEDMGIGDLREMVFKHAVEPLLERLNISGKVSFEKIEEQNTGRFTYGSVQGAINGTGRFVIGGSIGDAGVVGRKIVVDAYGPRVPVGGGAYSGKDPSKVDRSAAYMARKIAKTAVAEKVSGAHECIVQIAYGIGQIQPEMVTAVTDLGTDISAWVREQFEDLSQQGISKYLDLRNPNENWSYRKSAVYGHYGRDIFPWEKI